MTRVLKGIAAGAAVALMASAALADGPTLPAQYRAINHGWQVNGHCGFLQTDDAQAFAHDMRRIDRFASALLTPGYAAQLRAEARQATITCDVADLETVMTGLTAARDLADLLDTPIGAGGSEMPVGPDLRDT